MISVQLSRQQVQVFASAILNDIQDYVDTHEEEYEEYLKGIERAEEE